MPFLRNHFSLVNPSARLPVSFLQTSPEQLYIFSAVCREERSSRLKTLEGFLGSDIRETEVPFDLNRKLTQEELDQTVFYCRHDVEETIKVFLEKIDDFHAIEQHGLFPFFRLLTSNLYSAAGKSIVSLTHRAKKFIRQKPL